MKKEIGIYKITSPSKKIYIGQSVDIEERFKQYYRANLQSKKQPRLYNSFLKYGIINHKFEIIEKCFIENLNERERYWQDYYNVLDKYGLNCRLTETNNKSGKLSEQTCLKIKKQSSKRVYDILNKVYYESANDCAIKNGINPFILRSKLNGKTINTTFYIYEFEIPMEGINYNCEIITSKDKPIIDTETGIIYISLIKCVKLNNLVYSTLKKKLNGSRKNNTSFKYLTKNEYLIYKYQKLLDKGILENIYAPFNIKDSEYLDELKRRIEELYK